MDNAKRWLSRLLATICLVAIGALIWPASDYAAGPVRWTQTGGPPGGVVNVVAVHPNEPRTIFIGTQSGVYKSSDGGAHWTQLARERLSCQEIYELAIAPLEAQTIYAGGSGGLFRSMDGGESWVQLDTSFADDLILAIAVHPLRPEVLYVGSDGAVFRSMDRGEHWEHAGRGLPACSVWSLAIDPSNPQTIFAGTDCGLYRTDDGGDSWRPSGSGLHPSEPVRAVAIDPHLTRRIWAGTSRGLFRSLDGGTNWSAIRQDIAQTALEPPSSTKAEGFLPISDIVLGEENTIYTNAGLSGVIKSVDGGVTWTPLDLLTGELILSIAVHPADPERLYLGTVRGFYRSLDGGSSWVASNEGLVASDVRMVVDVPGSKDHLYAATRWGVYETRDGGQTWRACNRGLSNLNLTHLAVDPVDPKHLCVASWEGDIYHSTNGGDSWSSTNSPWIGDSSITGMVIGWRKTALDVPTILYVSTDGAGVWRSLDFGVSWEQLSAGLSNSRVGAIWLSPPDQRLVYVGAGREVYRLPASADPAEALVWRRITSQPLDGRVVSGLAEPGQRGSILVATDAGSLYRGESNGDWINLTRDMLPANLLIEALAMAAPKGRSPLIYVVTNGGLFSSKDDGRSWSLSSLGCLQRGAIRSIAVDDRHIEWIYVGTTKGGVYRGRDMTSRMASWVGYALVPVGALVVLMAGEAGRRYLAKYRLARQGRLLERNWTTWEQIISNALDTHDRITPDLLSPIPASMRLAAMRRYVDAHRDQDLVYQEEKQTIVPANHLKLKQFTDNWALLVERLDNPKRAAPIASQITEQLCELLGFSPLMNRVFRSLFGYMVRAPAIRLSIPSRFPLVFMLSRELGEEEIRDVRDLMSVLNVTSFFALLIVVDEHPLRKERARDLKRLVRGSPDEFIVLDYHDLRSLFLARDPERRFIDMILEQADLTMVSPYVLSGPALGGMFFGRDYELKAIMRTIRDRSFAIVGGRRIGKTSILTRVRELIEQTAGFMPFYLDCQYVISHENFFSTLAATCQVAIDSSSPEAFRRVILRLRRQRAEGTIVLLLDEVDGMLAYDMQRQTQLFRVFRAVSQEGLCRFVFCGERRLNGALHDPNSPLFNFAQTMRLSYLTEQNARRLIQEPMATLGIIFEDADALVNGIIELSSCHPNIVQAICQMLVVRVNSRGDRTIRMEDLAQVRTSDEFRDFFFEVTWGNATPLERLISVLMAGVASFTAADVRETLAAHGCHVSGAEIKAALDGLNLFSILRKQGNLYSFESKAFPIVLAESQMAQIFVESFLEELKAVSSTTQPPAMGSRGD